MSDGFKSLSRASPNMNSMVFIGVTASFFFSVAAVLFPALRWSPEFSEPVMLLGFILFGRALESRAKLQSSSSLQVPGPTRGALPPLTACKQHGALATCPLGSGARLFGEGNKLGSERGRGWRGGLS